MRLLLLNINTDLNKKLVSPLGLGYIASMIKNGNLAEVEILDLSFYKNPFSILKKKLKNLQNNENLIFGLSMNSHNRFSIKKISEIIKGYYPNSLIICGGPHITLEPKDTLKHCKAIDIAVIGEAEETIKELLKKIKSKNGHINCKQLNKIKGIAYRDKNTIIINLRRTRIKNLDKILFPDRDILKVKKYPPIHILGTDFRKVKGTNILGSRGCPYHCIFCSVANQWGKQTTFRSPEDIIKEINELYIKYGYNGIHFHDDTFTLWKERTIKFCKLMIAKKLNKIISWSCKIRADTVDFELLKLMKEAGCVSVIIGVESANQWLLDNIIKKSIKINQVKKIVNYCNKLNIYLKCFFSMGYPEETYEMALQTLKFREKIKCEEKVNSLVRIYPRTQLFEIAKKNKLIPNNFSWFKNYDSLEYSTYDKNTKKNTIPLFKDKLSNRQYTKLLSYLYQNESFINLIKKKIRYIKDIKSFTKYGLLAIVLLKNKLQLQLKNCNARQICNTIK